MGNLQNQHNVYIWILTNPQTLYKIRNLQFQPITKGPLSKIRNLHWAYLCRHLGCPKKWFWRTPGGPDNGVDFFGGITYTYIYTGDLLLSQKSWAWQINQTSTWPLGIPRKAGAALFIWPVYQDIHGYPDLQMLFQTIYGYDMILPSGNLT